MAKKSVKPSRFKRLFQDGQTVKTAEGFAGSAFPPG
jgi:hypothetical protein